MARYKLADLCIDAGNIVIADGCYIWPKDGVQKDRTPALFRGEVPSDWQEFCQYVDAHEDANGCLDLDHGTAVWISNFGGDVPCGVYVNTEGRRVTSVEIVFDDEEEEDENEWDDVLEDYGDDEEEE